MPLTANNSIRQDSVEVAMRPGLVRTLAYALGIALDVEECPE